ncbi:hypothetical protein [Marinoscillum pacificum]|uniref:hypothetical protein n=1 Tax=Marinoscillum pacificum TaxID=392723 RepID=UPI0021587D3A|nr:hypothetical protein [Marinoscillum pacificum]
MNQAFAQQGTFVDDFLNGSYEALKVKLYEQELTFLDDDPIKSSWIREVEIRAKAKHYNETIDDYRFRVSPTNPWEIKANKSYQSQLKEVSEINYSLAISKELKKRYLILITSYYQYQKLQLIDEELQVKKLTVDTDISTGKNLDPVDLIEIESRISELEIKRTTLELDHLDAIIPIQNESQSEVTWKDWKMIKPAKILELVYAYDTSQLQNIHKTLADSKFDLKKRMYQVNKSESFGNIGFMQANMDLDQGSDFNDHLGFQIGISIPIVNKKKADLARDRFDLIESQNNVDQTYEEVDFELTSITKKVSSLYQLIKLIDDKLSRSVILSERVEQNPTPGAVIKLEQYRVELKNQRNNVYQDLLIAYIEYLDLSGLLASNKNLNYLSPNLNSIH